MSVYAFNTENLKSKQCCISLTLQISLGVVAYAWSGGDNFCTRTYISFVYSCVIVFPCKTSFTYLQQKYLCENEDRIFVGLKFYWLLTFDGF